MSKSFLLKWVEPRQPLPKERQRFGNRELAALILPILVEQLLTMLVGIADTLMVSYAGEAAVSGVSLVNQLNNVFIFVFGAVASGGAVGEKPVYRQGGSGKRGNGCKSAADDHSPDIGGFDGDLRLVPVTAFIAFIWQGGAGCNGGVPYLPGHFGTVLSGACGL